ncbi:glycosyltransferase family 2 protein [Arcobacter defluvii]|uniref:Glycosyltransferase, family 2 n=1 Tax=Arcobacter defluvii TaxID=873191 RepID=A0AAE7BFJ4_9BACT|nr:glycosyltransferase family 2 protein [Arcobacter defluvii]QKF76874.1 glycosyltransferase, family 2 [Arcobacter defluvii]RXI33788.1 glycosyl transferase [Arcobacter defluvii]
MLLNFSLIIATLGRKKELFDLIDSLRKGDYYTSKIQIIIVDQNEKGFLDKQLLSEYKDLDIKYIHSDTKGLSLNRNIGLKYATGDIICFPDDDCKFYNDTLIEISNILLNPNIDFCMGQIYDRETKKDIIKRWSKKDLKVNRFNSYFINSSITMFIKKNLVLDFDENLGVGAKFGSCEDADFIYRILQNKANGIYTPKIELWHPEPNYQEISLEKVKNYASGFGYFIRKNIDTIKILLFILLIGKKMMQFILNIFKKRFPKGYFKSFFNGLYIGIKEYKLC